MIIKFLDFQGTIQIEKFKSDFQDDVNRIWQSSTEESTSHAYSLPNYINAVCFEDKDHNLRFDSSRRVDGATIEHLDIAKTTSNEDPLCIMNIQGKVSLTLLKGSGDVFVTVER